MKEVIKHPYFIDSGPTIELCLMLDSSFDILNIPYGKYLKSTSSQKNEVIIVLKLIIKSCNNI